MTKKSPLIPALLVVALTVSCNDGPRKIDPAAGSSSAGSSTTADGSNAPGSLDPIEGVTEADLAGTLGFSGSVEETMNAGRYTYVLVDTGKEKRWVAAPVFAVKVGETVEFPAPVLMENFHSPTLERDFEAIYFVSSAKVAGQEEATPVASGALPDGHPPIPAPDEAGPSSQGSSDVAAQAESPAEDAASAPKAETGPGKPAVPPLGADGFTGKVAETVSTGPYTYVHVEVGETKHWVAAPTFAVQVGDTVNVPRGMLMQDFHSPTLKRTFAKIFFVGKVHVPGRAQVPPPDAGTLPDGHPALPGADSQQQQVQPGHPPVPAEKEDVAKAGEGTEAEEESSPEGEAEAEGNPKEIQKAEGGQTVAEIIGAKKDLAGKKVLFRGKVVKFNAGILQRNWLHVQDGSGDERSNDLTVTTDATVRVGQTVLVRGTLTLDKDFGAGYRYDVIVEDASVTVE